MHTQTIQYVRGLVLFPFLSISFPFGTPDIAGTMNPVFVKESGVSAMVVRVDENAARAAKIDAYMKKRAMPLAGFGAKMVSEAEKNGIDWRLLPAIAIKESTGGKFACGNNPFGWGSCRINFKTFDEATETVARNLGGNNPNTAQYYKNKTTEEKLWHYNTSVIPSYTKEIFEFMRLIEN